jgi:redox-sensitive bicupin YhaK (pirin superfamily)
MPLTLARSPFESLRHGARLRQHRPARFGQARPLRALAVEQDQAELRFQIGDAIADHGRGAVELAAGAGETAGFDHGEENLQLVEGRDAGAGHFNSIERKLRFYPADRKRREALYLSPDVAPKQEASMIEIRPFDSLGHADHGWLDARHHFSFADYHDPRRARWGALRVWNDDSIAPGGGFPTHPHRDMEIVTYVRKGAITHRDSLGNLGRTEAGDVQVMSAGTGVAHSEYNLEAETTTLFQIWIEPTRRGDPPSWGARPFPKAARDGGFVALASDYAADEDALPIRAEARVLAATLKAGQTADYRAGEGRRLYLVPAAGAVEIEGKRVGARDGAAIRNLESIAVTALADSEVVLVDVPEEADE